MLTGASKNSKDIAALKKELWQIKGLKEIMDEIEITEKAPNTLHDHFLASQIKSKLLLDRNVKSLDINVEVFNAHAFLIGKMDSNANIRRAAKIASKVNGVKKVTSYLRQ